MKSIVMVDPYQIYLHGFSALIENHLEIRFFDTFDAQPDGSHELLILGFCPDHLESCFELAKKSELPLLALLDHGCQPYFKEILTQANPLSYLHRSAPRSIATKAVKATIGGEKFIDRKILPWFLAVFEDEAKRHKLTPQEIIVLRLVLKGLSNREIAHKLLISLPTVKFHLKNIFRKTQTANRKQLIFLFDVFSQKKV